MILEDNPLGEPFFFEPPPLRLITTLVSERGRAIGVDEPIREFVGAAKLPETGDTGATKASVPAHSVPAPTIVEVNFMVFLCPPCIDLNWDRSGSEFGLGWKTASRLIRRYHSNMIWGSGTKVENIPVNM